MTLIEPRTLKGFRDYLPEAQIPREWLIDTAKRVYRSYGFLPIDTPALEYAEILTGKGGDESDKQLYRFKDHGDRDVALRFDLTVPLARFVAQHQNDLGMPFKRYHVASVWRGENTQRGRYREFMQCDFDTIGTESIASDVETVLVVHDLFFALGIDRFAVRLNNRRVLNGMLEKLDLAGRTAAVLRAIDKLEKAGEQAVRAEIVAQAGASEAQASEVVAFARGVLSGTRTNVDVLGDLAGAARGNATAERGVEELRAVVSSVEAALGERSRVQIDPSIARGLDYYTGTIVETKLDELPTIGSVCSGGRYDDLASLYTKQRLPGIGASLGLDRLLAALEELGKLETSRASAPLFVPWFAESRFHDYLKLCADLRAAGVGVELYPEAKKLAQQLKYADRRGFRFALVVGEDEWKSGRAKLKTLATGTALDVPLRDANGAPSVELVRAVLS